MTALRPIAGARPAPSGGDRARVGDGNGAHPCILELARALARSLARAHHAEQEAARSSGPDGD